MVNRSNIVRFLIIQKTHIQKFYLKNRVFSKINKILNIGFYGKNKGF